MLPEGINKMFLGKYLERRWFKIRKIYYLIPGEINSCTTVLPEGFNVDVQIANNKGFIKFSFRIKSPFINNDCAVTNVVINSTKKLLWHDNYPVLHNEGLIYASFVDPVFRGRNFYVILLNYINDYFSERSKVQVETLVAVVEKNNFASKRSHEKCGYVIRENNFLLKFWGRNIFSFYSKPFRGYFVYKKRNSF